MVADPEAGAQVSNGGVPQRYHMAIEGRGRDLLPGIFATSCAINGL
jgi:hypothetical protein